jgi:nucleotide-binding universal stress UspA family protein
MRTILVPVGGGETDQVVFDTALAVATPLSAHLEFLHVRIKAGAAAEHAPHVAFARGAALANALDDLKKQGEARARAAGDNVLAFCKASGIDMREEPCAAATPVTARWRMEEGDALQRLVFHARHNDLVVMARARQSDGLPPGRLETLLMTSGRPLLIASSSLPTSLLRTVMVCWKETPQAARALSAALPLLAKAERVVVVGVNETDEPADEGVAAIVHGLRWHGIKAGSRVCAQDGLPTSQRLGRIAGECGATLMVMGGYGRGPTRELLFGGCTQAILEAAEVPVFLLH